ncbi:hypothetical protein L916_06713 [Phytophthora nicotianae]|uniref:Uncharacterized protein n=3 Tax=Phytophthora nicotianae TaxID=4792 RepID=V9FCI0_PHYNI|nr:hypothetical protein F443_06915 [Phytophthora nicotianae P1569]ETL42482.1 hypothetical protein L916_06713 [Phytophthora nicotianae]
MDNLISPPVVLLEAMYDDDLAGITGYWNRRFSYDVLVRIDRGYRLVGLDCHYHYGDVYEYPREICTNCYSYEQLISATPNGPLSLTAGVI